MNDNAKNFVSALGSLAESTAILYKTLLQNGFDRQEALELSKTYIQSVLKGGKPNE
jgi:hypothetical protein